MKKVFMALLLGLSTALGYSQVKISVQGGNGLNTITENENYKTMLGFRFGAGFEFPINRTWSMQTGLQVLNRKYNFNDTDEAFFTTEEGGKVFMAVEAKSKINAFYVQIPLKAAAYLPLSNSCGLQFSAGPYIAYGIGGKYNLKMTSVSSEYLDNDNDNDINHGQITKAETFNSHHKTFDKDNGFKRLDIGLSLGVDVKYKQLFVGIGVEYGLLPVSKEFQKDYFKYMQQKDQTLVSTHNFGVEFHVGFCFSAGK